MTEISFSINSEDPELAAIEIITLTVDSLYTNLDEQAKRRIFRYLSSRYESS